MRNINQPKPAAFEHFWRAIEEINVPRRWIGNKALKERVLSLSEQGNNSVDLSPSTAANSDTADLSHVDLHRRPRIRSRSHSPGSKWLTY